MSDILISCTRDQVESRTTSEKLAETSQLALLDHPLSGDKIGTVTFECGLCGEPETRALGRASMILWIDMLRAEKPDDPELGELLQTVITDYPTQPAGPPNDVLVR